jgi:dTDP-4-amino-4,6-dideoxygalactose transaminase
MGTMACWSMQESKLITSAGDGGFLTTDDVALAERARMARDHGRARLPAKPGGISYSSFEFIGNHYRLTEIQAAFALAQLGKLSQFRELRRRHTAFLDAHLCEIDGLILQKREGDIELSYAYYPVRFEKGRFSRNIDVIVQALVAEGVTAYPIAKDETCHTQPLFSERNGRGTVNCPFDCPHYSMEPGYGLGPLPNSERLAEELLLLPLYPDLTRSELEDIVHAVEKVAEALRVDYFKEAQPE